MDRDNAQWFKSSYSGGSGTECVEVAGLRGGGVVGVRDSGWLRGESIGVGSLAWGVFLGGVRGSGFGARGSGGDGGR
ncbi:DUF397 domain-containing protein [Streptomyces paludis]|uniref:DUF397 domain-containing protein n=1 Tax=Streptomyces paludis TaxID=2282738 RepID=A0A345HMW9_9ACTN|nr:DUF397 domain-containing protein [Streptomyces paludis]AXG78043.1 DUF397 domain-containing protein [Streptomyces paludis]